MMNAEEELLNKIEHYKKIVRVYQNKVQDAKEKINKDQMIIEETLFRIVSDLNLSTKERTEQMIPLMEKQDKLKVFLEQLESLVEKENERIR